MRLPKGGHSARDFDSMEGWSGEIFHESFAVSTGSGCIAAADSEDVERPRRGGPRSAACESEVFSRPHIRGGLLSHSRARPLQELSGLSSSPRADGLHGMAPETGTGDRFRPIESENARGL